MQYLIDQAVFTANSVMVVQGSNSLYTYQNIGNASGTIQGSNDNSTWATIVTIASGNTAVIEHSYKYLKLVGNTQILVNRGEGNNTPDGGMGSADYPPFTDNANKVLAVKPDETGVEWTTVSSGGVALGETSSTAYRGDNGKIAYDHSLSQGNPHNTTTSDINEGTKLFFTESRVNQTVLTGLNTSTATPALATDQLLAAIGKLQAQINASVFNWVDVTTIAGTTFSIPAVSLDLANTKIFLAKKDGNLWLKGYFRLASSMSSAQGTVFRITDTNWVIDADPQVQTYPASWTLYHPIQPANCFIQLTTTLMDFGVKGSASATGWGYVIYPTCIGKAK